MAKINWFPGHMAKGLKELQAEIQKCDYFIETCDSRLPSISRNPKFKQLWERKKGMLLLTKSDLADPNQTTKWLDHFREQGYTSTLAVDLLNKSDINKIRTQILKDNEEILERAKKRGLRIKPIRVMVNGIPNTGKSTLINKLTGKNTVKTSNRPGVTKGISWLRAGNEFYLMDSPGILWPKIETVKEQLILAISGAIKDNVIPMVEVACGLIMILCQLYPDQMSESFELELPVEPVSTWLQAYQILEEIGLFWNLVKKGNEIDIERAASRLLIDYRQGKMGRLSLESLDQELILPETI
ncbi:MAG: ribosome biogenesis GTPase YlqF [Clostridiaceae bacterium]|nr:ribosome biogenesis GTPase YlqF [Clostridiaceae bacterium]